MKKIASAVAAVCLTATVGIAAPLLFAAPASAAPESENAQSGTAACSHVWLYSQQNYGGTQFFHDCNQKEIQGYPTAINSLIYNGGGKLCGLGLQRSQKYAFMNGSYSYIGAPFTDSNPMRASAWSGIRIGVDPTGTPLFLEC
ncbi:hypothetical protein OHA98_25800 [Streptomyces sp. NBC_00654]|uniref:hypothetical protein n=1 Tax=Streptomyces sp. NBC_00654 TaxID=2975799 RepID=UPI002257BC18|nr:hypothetical protein [Streptomyces sp. NBC_00654]MCX4968111.1 hypothetical protein [Streptomyces sp. NBC_00654]